MIGTVSVYKDNKLIFTKHNQIQDDSKSILSHLVSGDSKYKIGKFYIEYKNVASVDEQIVTPSFTTDEGVSYYLNLDYTDAEPVDFLREAIVLPPEITDTSVTFSLVLASGTGYHGIDFGIDGVHSIAYGMALVASPVESNASNDLIYSRTYWDVPVVKEANQNLYITWTIDF